MFTANRSRSRVLSSEQAFFDDDAAGITDEALLIKPDQMARYREARLAPGNIPKEAMFALLQPLQGKRVLEYGCGTGIDSCHLADCGAHVHAFDLSPVSIEKARQRAALLNLGAQIDFEVGAAGQTGYRSAMFDVVAGIAILHHLHTELHSIYDELNRVLKPGGIACFVEPVANCRSLRALRSFVPVARNATPDERQLTYADFEMARSHDFKDLSYSHFHGFTRLNRVLGGRCARAFRWMDYYPQRLLPFLRRFYGIVVFTMKRADE